MNVRLKTLTMSGIERTRKAIFFKSPDRIPHFLPDGGENDILWFAIPRPQECQPWMDLPDGRQQRMDCWGVTWERGERGSFGQVKAYPITDITRQSEYAFPPLNDSAYFIQAQQVVEENNDSPYPKYCLSVMPFNSLNEGVHNLIGLDTMFMAYYEHPEDLKALIARLAEKQQESIRRLAEIGCHGIMAYDDWGLQDRPMIGINLIEEFFMPHYRANWKLAHDLGMEVWMHSCGYIIDLLPMFIEAGLNVIQMDQQENMGLENLDQKVGGRIAFWCPVDIQKMMVQGCLADIDRYVQRMMRTLGQHHGGLISMSYSAPEAVGHTPEKIQAMCQAFRTHGVYKNNQ